MMRFLLLKSPSDEMMILILWFRFVAFIVVNVLVMFMSYKQKSY